MRTAFGPSLWNILLLLSVLMTAAGWAADPLPSKTSTVGMAVLNPVTNASTTVSALIVDPVGTPTAGDTAFVRTADGYVFLVKAVNELVYNNDSPPASFKITSVNTTDKTVQLQGVNPPTTTTATLGYQILFTTLQAQLLGADEPGAVTPPVLVAGADGVRVVNVGQNGSNGRDGALFVPPSSGGSGAAGPLASYTTTFNISTNNKIGLEVGSQGGRGGNGGDSYASFWDGRDGGNGGAGGPVVAINGVNIQINTTGADKFGIYAYSRSGQAGNGGSGYGAPGGGTGGHSSDGGTVDVTNNGTIITSGSGAFGIYGLSVSNNGGSGGDTWGLVGSAGAGNYGGNGGTVTITNSATGSIYTSGDLAHGIVAQSIGGTGGSSGSSSNLILSLNGAADNGGNGGLVNVYNSGLISTTGTGARGIMAQSIGGGGGSGGTSAGLFSLGGSGSNGGSSNAVTVENRVGGQIITTGVRSDGILAQSIGGSGGSGSNSFGLVAVGGGGSKAGNGGTVTVRNLGTIQTAEDHARGIVAQSIGGGGGDGGSTGGLVSVGGSGAGGGDSSTVTVQHGGTIITEGNDAQAILAQAIGGGGGNGGSSGSIGLMAGVSVGGDGGKGGQGGNVAVTLQGQNASTASIISTEGDRSTGVFAQSVGGGGGNGGGAVTVTAGFEAGASFAIGGKGGSAGDGGLVTLSKGTGSSNVQTLGDNATGVFLQSVGGGGGSGGFAVSVALSSGLTSGSLSVAIGGDGGGGGKGGDVTVGSFGPTGTLTSTGFSGDIYTQGNQSTGFLAQSVGGGGGNGGLAVAAAGSAGLIMNGSMSIGVGGTGAGGGAGGTVLAGTQGNITTAGNNSTGFLAQSVGGGGGNGGGSVAASIAISGGVAASVGVSVGGDAGPASNGGDVTAATRSGTISTSGENSKGIVVQSIGGGGGNGGYAVGAGAAGSVTDAVAVNVGVGGKGGGGGNGGTVKADLQTDVETSSITIARAQDPVTGVEIPEHYAKNATGILVQSIGGGGGSGGFSVAAGAALSGGGSGAVSVGLGGKGAQGGEGGSVTVSSTGTVTTKGDSSAGLVAQSIGGGGGSGGFSVSVAGAASSVGSGAINVGLGGSGGSGNFARDVTVNTSIGKITTYGADSQGILAQSIGGGGGNGAYNVGVAAAGSGGGSGAISVGLGGSGGSGGYAGTVRLTVANAVSTYGKNSAAIVAQAIGGGGGAGGYNVSAAGAGAGSGAGAISVGLGGSGGSGSHGGEVYLTATGNVDTLLENSQGIVAQSIGGGGGSGGYNVSVAGSGGMGAGGISVGLGGNGAGGGNGLKVELGSSGTILTQGANSIGLLGQSIGGGGGSGGFNVSVAIAGSTSISGAVSVGLGGSGAGGGDGGIVILNSSGSVTTEGNNSAGIVGQSIGGGGGSGGFNVSVAGAIGNGFGGAASVGLGGSGGGGGNAVGVTVTVNNNVTTKGKKSTGVIAQSIGGGGGNGGFDVTAPVSGASGAAGSIGVSIGGSGAGGGNAGVVTSSVTGTITTEKEGSGGMLAQSIGGGGGNGGMSIVGAMSFSATGSGAISIGLGGSGGVGGNADNVYSTLNGSVFTVEKDSFGVVAQSIGGGGGSGGMSISGAIALAKEGAGALAFGLGGAGGEGGDAGALVRNIVNGYVQTQGANSVGVLSQSLGGGGGAGGLNVSGTITGAKQGSGGLAIGIGGLGGDGGEGKEVISTVTGGVITTGKDSAAIVAQSLGGGGGTGGLNVTGSINVSKENGGTLGVGVGGFGGDGGNAGTVTSTVVATSAYNNLIGTLGDNSSAVVAQSIGGGGGDGGLNVTGGLNITGKSGASIGVGLGGFGGVAGNGGVVTADVTGNIITQGNESHGIVAQSIGGAGGNGGINVTGTMAFAQSPATTAAVSVGVGGFGGNGGTANSVTVNYNGTLTARPTVWVPGTGGNPGQYQYTDGAGSNGIMAQSIGGGGGNGGMNVSGGISYVGGTGHGYGVVVGVGGFGGDGGDAGTSTVNVTGGDSITAWGTGHSAIVAQSLGGGGGNGGINISGGITSDSGLLFGVGGFAGDAGTATTVRVTSTTNVFATTLNANEDEIASAGILAQSIGGGGGNGGLNVTGGLAIAKQAGVPSVNFGIGGFGGAGASSGDVIVNHTGNATTSGNWVHGIMAQSIAGGGGNGAMNVGGQVNFAASENSGGNTDLSIIAGIGGTAGDGSFAGNVTVTHNGIVTTSGDNARGVAAQSIGGGGGTGGMNVTGVYAKNSNPITVGIGGTGGSAGDAGTATIIRGSTVAATGKVTTDGVGAHAIEASSIGGGGGDAGMNFNVGYSSVGEGTATAGFAANFIIGGGGGDAASGKAATVTNYSAIETKQDKAYGILAQSIGGGGGNANFNIGVTHAGASTSAGSNLYNKPNQNMALSLAVGGATGDGGFGGDVTVTQVGDLTTAGKQSIGILAQSIGGGGGNAGLDVAFIKADGGKAGITIGRVGGTGGYGGTVVLNYTGTLNTTGEMAFGLLAQSLGNGGGNSSSTTISGEIPSGQNDLGQTRPQSGTLAIGLEGGVGGYGGNVTLNSNGRITTQGRRAYGAFAQSIGGGGGNGGKANSFGITAPVIAITLGGTGGSGGYGGQVDLTNTAIVETFGEEAVGLLAQSIGGGGGNGGSTYAGGTKTGDTGITVGIGGAGAAGMDGGIVNVANDGIVVTHDLAAHGILAQSIGGGGGDGGSAISMLTKMHPSNPNATDTTRVSVNVGGNGGTGGDGKAVTVTNRGGIGTYEDASVGIFAQSIGGGGGNGKSVLSASLAGTSGNNVGINIGGNGGTGGTGGVVTVKNEKTSDPDSAKIITLGDKAHGILAMSVGGGGGTGSNVAAITRGTGGVDGATTVTQVNFTMGGSGGTGGIGGLVEVVNEGSISTAGKAAHGIIAQSIGGGGGQGGMAISGDLAFGSKIPTGNDTYNVAIGGQGGTGEAGGEVKVNNSGTIHVTGEGSYGIYAQSVGGGGGDGGFAAAFSRNLIKNPKDTLAGATSTFALGGFGGSGGDGGPVTVTHTGTIQADGDNAYGIFAQSVSGGGGNAAFSLSSPVWTVADFALKTLIGGGSAGTAGKVTLNTTGDIIMNGKNSIAFFSQSVNGGGGNVNQFMDFSQQAQGLGDNGLPLPGNAGDIDTAYAYLDSVITMGSNAVFGTIGAAVEAAHLGSYFSDGDNGGGGLLQSVGGGGGRGSQEILLAQGSSEINLVVQLGGEDVSDSSGGNVTYSQTGGVSVTGDQSAGVTVQTIGGGGGVQFVTLHEVPQATPPPPPPPAFGPLALPAPPPPPGSPSVTLGANGGLNNHGGVINNTYSGPAVTIVGDRSAGLIHQSIGAGGGAVYANLPGLIGLNAALGGYNGASGNGGDITVTNSRGVSTNGILSHAILFQSIGGGGGAIFTDLDPSLIAVALNTANTGNGGNIMLTQNGDVYALGDRSTAVILQSLGGGGGIVDDLFAGAAGGTGNSGTITLVMNGDIVATGASGSGVFAQSQGSGTQGNITVTLVAGKNLYFGDGGTGVKFSGGAANLFTNNGTVVGTEGVTGWAFRGEEGNDTIQNNNSFTGNADFGGGTNAFNNASGAALILGPQFFLGAAGNTLTNDGVMRIGGTNLAQHTDMTGGFTQTSTGTTFTELDFGTDVIDNVSMTGAGSFDGSIEVALLNPQLVPVGTFQKILFHADGGVTDNGMDLVTAPSVVINYGLNYLPNGNDLALDYSVNFNPPGSGMSRNLVEVGAHINSIQNAGSSPSLAAVIIRLLYEPTMDGYRALLSQMGPDFYGEQQAEMLRGTQRFGETVLGGGSTRFMSHGRRIWFDVLGSSTFHGRFDDYKTTQQSTTGFALGFESLISRGWSAGLAVALEDNMASGYEGRWSAEGTSQRVGGVVRFRSKGTEIAGLLSYGWNQMDSSRVGQVANPFDTNVERNIQTFTAMVRAAHQFGDESFAVVPRVDVGVTHLSAQNATESGADAISLYLHDVQETHAWLRPAVTIRKAIPVFRQAKLRIQAEIGYQYYLTGNDTYVKGGFTGAPNGVDPMNVPIDLGSMATLSLGAQLMMANDLSIGLYYTKAFSEKYKVDLWNVRVNKEF